MQRIGNVHVGFRAVEGCGKQARILDRNARQPREGPEYRRDYFRSKAVVAPQDPFAFQQNRCARKRRPAVDRGPALADWSGSSPVRYRTMTLVSIARMRMFRFRHNAGFHLRQGPWGTVAGEPAKDVVRPGLREPWRRLQQHAPGSGFDGKPGSGAPAHCPANRAGQDDLALGRDGSGERFRHREASSSAGSKASVRHILCSGPRDVETRAHCVSL